MQIQLFRLKFGKRGGHSCVNTEGNSISHYLGGTITVPFQRCPNSFGVPCGQSATFATHRVSNAFFFFKLENVDFVRMWALEECGQDGKGKGPRS